MKTSGNTVLVTGGATGIGFALAESFLKEGNEVIICGRREQKLQEAKRLHPEMHIRICDVSEPKERVELHRWAAGDFPDLNILVNNAGVQHQIDLKKGTVDLQGEESEIRINFESLVMLSGLFIPGLMKKKESAIVNVSSGLAFIPLAIVPVYCATKAATHSYTLSLRHQLSKTSVRVFEVIPPTVDTELDRDRRDKRAPENRGIQPGIVGAEALEAMKRDELEIVIGAAQNLRMGSRSDPEKVFNSINR